MALPLSPVPDGLRKQVDSHTEQWLTSLRKAVNALQAATLTGTGSPEGVVTAPQGTVFLRSDGGVGTTVYAKSSGGTTTPTNTGWSALS